MSSMPFAPGVGPSITITSEVTRLESSMGQCHNLLYELESILFGPTPTGVSGSKDPMASGIAPQLNRIGDSAEDLLKRLMVFHEKIAGGLNPVNKRY